MKHVYSALFIFAFFYQANSFQQNDLIVATIDELEIHSGELLYAYKKNRDEAVKPRYDSLREYLDQYVNFKLKVMEARALGMDTSKAFKDELNGYVSQVRKPYLQSPKAEEDLIRKTYERMRWEINASHILLKSENDPSPQDTLKAYQLIDSLRKTVSNKAQFEKLARQFSQDGSAKNGGSLGWFTAMDMVSPFEEAAYNTKVNQVSDIIKTRFGYHILFVNDKRLTKGKIKTSHIFFSHRQRGADLAFKLAQEAYDSIQSGAEWNEIARKYSEDNRTKMNGGQLPWAKIRQLPDDFMDVAYTLQNVGDITAPSRTQFGWHIIRLDDVNPLPEFSALRNYIADQLKRMGRNTLNMEQLLAKLKAENGFQQNTKTLQDQLSATAQGAEVESDVVFRLGDKPVQIGIFKRHMAKNGNKAQGLNQIKEAYEKFEEEYLLAYEDSIAPIKYPEYGYLLKEYEEGLLLFEIMQKAVWDKGIQDTLDIQAYYQQHLEHYKVEKRFEVEVVSASEQSLVNRLIRLKSSNQKLPLDSLINRFNENERGLLKIVKRTFKANEIPNFDSNELIPGSWIRNDDTEEWYLINKIAPAGYYPLDEVRGRVISDYQDSLEKQWIDQLRKKRKIKVNKKALKGLTTN